MNQDQMRLTAEEWRPVKGFECFYQVSDQGQVRSLDRIARNGREVHGRILRPGRNKGYLQVSLNVDGKGHNRAVHALVAEAFIGPRPLGLDVCHNNGKRDDNRAANLRYDTRKGNFADCVVHGTRQRGSKSHRAKLTEADVLEIAASTATVSELASRYGVHKVTIRDIFAGRSWAWLTQAERRAA